MDQYKKQQDDSLEQEDQRSVQFRDAQSPPVSKTLPRDQSFRKRKNFAQKKSYTEIVGISHSRSANKLEKSPKQNKKKNSQKSELLSHKDKGQVEIADLSEGPNGQGPGPGNNFLEFDELLLDQDPDPSPSHKDNLEESIGFRHEKDQKPEEAFETQDLMKQISYGWLLKKKLDDPVPASNMDKDSLLDSQSFILMAQPSLPPVDFGSKNSVDVNKETNRKLNNMKKIPSKTSLFRRSDPDNEDKNVRSPGQVQFSQDAIMMNSKKNDKEGMPQIQEVKQQTTEEVKVSDDSFEEQDLNTTSLNMKMNKVHTFGSHLQQKP